MWPVLGKVSNASPFDQRQQVVVGQCFSKKRRLAMGWSVDTPVDTVAVSQTAPFDQWLGTVQGGRCA